MQRDPHMGLISVTDLPEYPFGSDNLLPGNYFLKWETTTWFQSRMWLHGDPEVSFAYLNLIFKSQHARPIGTIPADVEGQVALLEHKFTAQKWRAMCRADPGPLHKWRPYRCEGGEIRLGHPVVIDMISSQLTRRDKAENARMGDAVRQRIGRVRKAMTERGVDARVLSDDTLIERMDAWLNENVHGRRDFLAYDRVLQFAASEGWFARNR